MKEENNADIKPDISQEYLNEPEEPESYGIISRIIGVFTEPNIAFKHIAQKPEIWGPIIVALFVGIVFTFVTMSRMIPLSEEMTHEMLTNMELPQEIIDQQVTMIEKTAPFGFINILFTFLIAWAIAALLIWVASMFMGHSGNYKSTISVLAYSTLPSLLINTGIISTVLFMTGSWENLSDYIFANMKFLSLYGLFGNPEMNVFLQSILSMIDPFLIWGVFLMAMGFQYANKVKPLAAWHLAIMAAVIWIAVNIPGPATTLQFIMNAG